MTFLRFIAGASTFFFLASAGLAQVEERKGFFEPQRKQYIEGVAKYPLIKQHKIDEVFHLRMSGTSLQLDTPLDADREYQQRRAELEGMSEPAVVLCWYISQDLGQVQFELNVDDYSDPMGFGRLHMLSRPIMKDRPRDPDSEVQSLDIEKLWQTPSGFRRIFFNQSSGSCRMVIFANDGGANGFVNATITEKDFAMLRRNHPAETEKWLRPILRELHQESAFAADPASAWQVLSAEWPINDNLAPSIQQKIKDLDADDFRVRGKAGDELQKIGRDAALVMLRMDRRSLSLEQNLRVEEVIARFRPLSPVEAKRLAGDPNFLLDCLYGDDPIARKLALKRLEAITTKPIEFDLNAPEDARVRAVNELRLKLHSTDPASPAPPHPAPAHP